jgi:hypothetical protein
VDTTQPYFPFWSGTDEIYQEAIFNVPAGTDRLTFNAAYQFTGQDSLVHVALFQPDGTYAGYSLPQGSVTTPTSRWRILSTASGPQSSSTSGTARR